MNLINKGFAIGASVLAGSVLALSASSAQAATIQFAGGNFFTVNGLTTFTFVDPSQGAFESDLYLLPVNQLLLSEQAPGFLPDLIGDYEGTCDICNYTFDFGSTDLAYNLELRNNGAPSVFSNTNAAILDTISPTEALVSFDDSGAGPDFDFNDFTFTIATSQTVPEPTALAGLGLVAGALAFSRRRKVSKTL